MKRCHQVTSLLRCDCIKRSDSTLDLVNSGLVKCLNQCGGRFPTGRICNP